MTKEQEIILLLIRQAIAPSTPIHIPFSTNWPKVMNLAMEQGVLGICLSAIVSLPPNQCPDRNTLMIWLGLVSFQEKTYSRYLLAIEHLSTLYNKESIRMMVLKGFGNSLFWPSPSHRPTGDIDVYLYGDWQKADNAIKKVGIIADDAHEHHTTFLFEGFMVENHYDIIDTKAHKRANELERIFKTLADDAIEYKLGNSTIYLPTAQFNAIYLMRHMGAHFSGELITLRQLLDWAFFIKEKSSDINWTEAIPYLKDIGIYRLFNQLNAICVDSLGFCEDIFPQISRESKLQNRILMDILNPEYGKIDKTKNTFSVILRKTQRFFANRWKRKLVYKESLFCQFYRGCLAHLKHLDTIKD